MESIWGIMDLHSIVEGLLCNGERGLVKALINTLHQI